MLTRTDILTFDRRYRRFRAELRLATNIKAGAVAIWMATRRDQLARGFVATPDSQQASPVDFEIYIRRQYARAMGLAL